MRKKEWTNLEASRRASLINEDTLQMKAPELAAEASSSRLEALRGAPVRVHKV